MAADTPSGATVIRDLFELLDARIVDGAALEPRRVGAQYRDEAGVATRAAQDASPGNDSKVGAAPVHPDPLFPRTEAA